MRTSLLERLSDLLLQWSEEHPDEHELRDHVAALRHHIEGEIDGRPGTPVSAADRARFDKVAARIVDGARGTTRR